MYAEEEYNVTLLVLMFEPVPPITTFQSSLIDGCMQRPIFRSHSSTSSCPKGSPSPLLSSTCRPYHCQLCTTKSSKHFMPTRFRHSTKYKHRFSKPCTLPWTMTLDENIFIGAPTGSGKMICAEFTLLQLWYKPEQLRAVCIEPYQEMVGLRVKEWASKFQKLQGEKEIVSLTGETSANLQLLEKGDIIICTPAQKVCLNNCPSG